MKTYSEVFCDKKPPINTAVASIESSRCYFCYDAPCIQACPTEINIPSFIRKINTENIKGAALDILNQNIMGGTCARVCPVESLCEQACVRNTSEDKPVAIGELQRFATDWLFEKKIQPFTRAKSTGKKIAIVGAGPAGLSCAHRLSLLGHSVVIFESKEKPGGLNEYGLAAYKVVDNFVQKEINFILALGGIEIKYSSPLGKKITLASLRKEFDAVFMGVGLGGVNALNIPGEELPHVIDAVEYISQLRQTKNINELKVGRHVVVVGGGNTAIDIAVQSKLLGAQDVTLLYRRGPKEMGATWKEQLLAKKSGVLIKYWMKPTKIIGTSEGVTQIEVESVDQEDVGKFTLECDMVFKAIGQTLRPDDLGDASEVLKINKGKISVNSQKRTDLANVFAGGDCINGGGLTVTAVQDGKIAAQSIHELLCGGSKNG